MALLGRQHNMFGSEVGVLLNTTLHKAYDALRWSFYYKVCKDQRAARALGRRPYRTEFTTFTTSLHLLGKGHTMVRPYQSSVSIRSLRPPTHRWRNGIMRRRCVCASEVSPWACIPDLGEANVGGTMSCLKRRMSSSNEH